MHCHCFLWLCNVWLMLRCDSLRRGLFPFTSQSDVLPILCSQESRPRQEASRQEGRPQEGRQEGRPQARQEGRQEVRQEDRQEVSCAPF
jgi:hypothetical protein